MRAEWVCVLAVLAVEILSAAGVSGRWTAEMPDRYGNFTTAKMTLKAEDGRLTGWITDARGETEITDGKIYGDSISFQVVREFRGDQVIEKYRGRLEGDIIEFSVAIEGSTRGPREFEAEREN